jgi:hypothetical protein
VRGVYGPYGLFSYYYSRSFSCSSNLLINRHFPYDLPSTTLVEYRPKRNSPPCGGLFSPGSRDRLSTTF